MELEKAIDIILDSVKKVEKIEGIDVFDIDNRVLATDIYAKINQPPFDRSPLDGYAIKASDIAGASKENPIKLEVIDCVYAGFYTKKELKDGQAVRIMTGAKMPTGADCVIRQEDTDLGEEIVEIYISHKEFENFCFEGEDMKKDQLLFKKGELLDYQHVGILASQGYKKVQVFEKVKVLLITTGDEVLDPKEELLEGKIYNSNQYIIAKRLEQLGVICEKYHIGDDFLEISNIILENKDEFDIVITTGGVSVGVKDIMHDVVKNINAERIFWKINIKPGTPVLYSKLGNLPILSLSGNPFASYATFELIARPLIAKVTFDERKNYEIVYGKMKNEFLKSSKTRRFIRAIYKNGEVFLTENNHSSGSIYTMARCNALIDIEAGNDGLKLDDTVKIIKL